MSALSDYLDRLEKPDQNGLLPCPFCGGSARIVNVDDWERWAAIECSSCEAQAADHRIEVDGERERAVTEWNRRPLLAALREAIAQRDERAHYGVATEMRAATLDEYDAAILAKLEGR